MRLQNNEERNKLILKMIDTIDEYYDYSFRVHNDRCFVIIFKLIERLEILLQLLNDVEQEIDLRSILNNVANAMATKDYVLIRDLLHYELRSKLNILQK